MLYTVTYTIEDAKGQKSRFKLHTESSLFDFINDNELVTLQEYFTELANRLAPCINGAIVGCSITLNLDVSAAKPAAESGSDVEETAVFLINDYIRFTVPTFDHNLFAETDVYYPGPGRPIELDLFLEFLLQAEDAADWPAEFGGITDNRGVRPAWFKSVRRGFKSSRA